MPLAAEPPARTRGLGLLPRLSTSSIFPSSISTPHPLRTTCWITADTMKCR